MTVYNTHIMAPGLQNSTCLQSWLTIGAEESSQMSNVSFILWIFDSTISPHSLCKTYQNETGELVEMICYLSKSIIVVSNVIVSKHWLNVCI